MELLPFLYALLAAITGVSAGDRVAMVERAPVSACAASVGHEQGQVARVVKAIARPVVRLEQRLLAVQSWVLTTVDARMIFRIAGFAVRRE